MNYKTTNKHTIERVEYENGEVMFDLHTEYGRKEIAGSTSTLHHDIPSLFIQLLENEGEIELKDNIVARLDADDIKNLSNILMGAVKSYIEVSKGIRTIHYR
jgi:hypothetical protein